MSVSESCHSSAADAATLALRGEAQLKDTRHKGQRQSSCLSDSVTISPSLGKVQNVGFNTALHTQDPVTCGAPLLVPRATPYVRKNSLRRCWWGVEAETPQRRPRGISELDFPEEEGTQDLTLPTCTGDSDISQHLVGTSCTSHPANDFTGMSTLNSQVCHRKN